MSWISKSPFHWQHSIVIPNIQLKLSDSKSPSDVMYLNCHHLTVRTRLLLTNKAFNELRHPASDSAGPRPRCWSGSPWSRASPSDSEWNREKSTVAGSGRRDSEKKTWPINRVTGEASVPNLFEFYHGQTFDDEVKKLDGGEYLPIIYKSFAG